MPRRAVLVVIPALDESATIATVVSQVRALTTPVDVLVVDDGSTDGTGTAARQAGAIVVCHPFRLGYGAALQTGYLYALRAGYEHCVQMDADGQHDESLLPALLEALKSHGANVAIASRVLAGLPAATRLRGLGTRLLRALGRSLAAVEVTDPTSGFRALDRRALGVLASEFPDDYPDLDVLILMRYARLRVTEIAGAARPRAGGRSMHDGLRPLYYLYKVSFAAVLAAWRGRRRGLKGWPQ